VREGKEVGAATTIARSPRAGGWVGLGLLHRKHGELGTRLQLGVDGPTATVMNLPITP
jgi:glycine cleavage system aminomethyltransferase T